MPLIVAERLPRAFPERTRHRRSRSSQSPSFQEFGIRKSKILVDLQNGQKLKEGTSLINRPFTEYTFNLVQKLLAAGFNATEILVVTPYAAQKRQYMGGLRHMSATNIVWAVNTHGELKITTVGAIQGGEAVIVIVDLVAAGEKASPFVQDYRRLNVAVSRARDGLIIVGDSKTVDQDTLKDAPMPNPKTKKVKKLSKRDLYTSIFLQAKKEEWVFAADAPENAGRLRLAGYTEDVITNTVNEDWQNATGDTFAAGDWNESGDASGSGSGNTAVEW